HPAVLERAGRVVALDLEPDLATGDLGEPARLDQRRAALTQCHRRGALGDVEEFAVFLDHPPPLVARCRCGVLPGHSFVPSTRITEVTSRTMSMPCSASTVARSWASVAR